MIKDTLTIGGCDFDIFIMKKKQIDLQFYPENPRIYSLIYIGNNSPNQSYIEKKLINTEHVKQLAQSIKANGGLIDPILVRSGDNVVLEGNCRLAAYRILAKGDPIKWGEIKCKVLTQDIDSDSVFKLLGQYHIIGRKDWAPFEQAGYLWRRKQKYGVSENDMAGEMGIVRTKIKRLIDVYQFMIDNDDSNPQHWSFYYEYLKSPPLRKMRSKFSELDEVIVDKVKSGAFSDSNKDVRSLATVAKLGGKTGKKLIKKFINCELSLDEIKESAVVHGADNTLLKSLDKFKSLIHGPNVKRIFESMTKEQIDQAEYDVRKISSRSTKLGEHLRVIKSKKANTFVQIQNESKELNANSNILASDIPQFSDFNDASFNVVNTVYSSGDNGLTFDEIGYSLLGGKRKPAALKKYGENHAKFAELLQFVKINKETPRKVFVTTTGVIFLNSSMDKQKSILTASLLKMDLIQDLLTQDLSNFNLLTYLKQFLADSTAKRRASNVKQLIVFLAEYNLPDFVKIRSKL